MKPVVLDVVLERKAPGLAAFVVVPAKAVSAWKLTGTTTVDATLDTVSLGRRSLKRWDEDRFFLELRRESLEALAKAPGDRARLRIAIASEELPEELERLLSEESGARARWEAASAAQRRMLREELLTLKTAAARERRARRWLLPRPTPPAPRVAGLAADPQVITLRIIGRRLPGTRCGPYTEVRVGLPAGDPVEPVSAGARQARWETRIEVFAKAGSPGFRGPAVNGPPHERFVYLTWIGRLGGAPPAMFRRAKLRLDAVPADVLSAALGSGTLTGRLDLTAPDGMPVCASVRPPAIDWSA